MMFLLTTVLLPASAAEGPCDILAAAGNDCVAAHSTVRALYATYAGPLYRLTRPAAGNASADVKARAPGSGAFSFGRLERRLDPRADSLWSHQRIMQVRGSRGCK